MNSEEKEALKAAFPKSKAWVEQVDKMKPQQATIVYNRLKNQQNNKEQS